MQSKKIMLVIPFILLSGIAWISAVGRNNNQDDTDMQTELIEKADSYMADKAYIRAIPMYKEAYGLNGTLKEDAAQKLISLYNEYGQTRDYYNFITERCDDGTASETEYIDLAQYFLVKNDYETAMNYLDKGYSIYQSENISEIIDEHYYDHHIGSGTFEDIIPSKSSLTPFFQNEKWGYVNSSGAVVIDAVYDEAVPFANGLAMVKNGSEYEIINSKAQRYSLCKEDISELSGICKSGSGIVGIVKDNSGKYMFVNEEFFFASSQYDFISPYSDGVYTVRSGEKWGTLDQSRTVSIEPKYEGFAFNKYNEAFNRGVAFVKESGSYRLINSKGEYIGDNAFEDAKAFYSSGKYAAVKSNGKWGFINASGDVVIDFIYEDADSFSNGIAAVKDLFGWKYIDDDNEIAIDGQYLDACPLNDYGSAFVKCENGWQLLTLEYFN